MDDKTKKEVIKIVIYLALCIIFFFITLYFVTLIPSDRDLWAGRITYEQLVQGQQVFLPLTIMFGAISVIFAILALLPMYKKEKDSE